MPNAIQPHWVLLESSSLFDAAAAPAAATAAGFTPEVVVAAAVVAADCVTTAAVCVVTVAVLGGTVWVTVGVGSVVVTVTVVGRVTVSAWTGGSCDVAGGVAVVVGVVRVVTERVGVVGSVLVEVRIVPTAEPSPPPPHDASAKPANPIRIPTAVALTGRAACDVLLARAYNPTIIHAASDASNRALAGCSYRASRARCSG
jgi:hypothetical protein